MKTILLLTASLLLSSCGVGEKCKSKTMCTDKSKCDCWCSQKCGYRKKTENDKPVYVEKDAYGKFCYCKEWDLDHYEDNCIDKKGVKEPQNNKK